MPTEQRSSPDPTPKRPKYILQMGAASFVTALENTDGAIVIPGVCSNCGSTQIADHYELQMHESIDRGNRLHHISSLLRIPLCAECAPLKSQFADVQSIQRKASGKLLAPGSLNLGCLTLIGVTLLAIFLPLIIIGTQDIDANPVLYDRISMIGVVLFLSCPILAIIAIPQKSLQSASADCHSERVGSLILVTA